MGCICELGNLSHLIMRNCDFLVANKSQGPEKKSLGMKILRITKSKARSIT